MNDLRDQPFLVEQKFDPRRDRPILTRCSICQRVPCFLHIYDYINLKPEVKWIVEMMTRRSIHDFYDHQRFQISKE